MTIKTERKTSEPSSILYPLSSNSGQVMLITSLVLSGTILGATTIAGLLMLYQIRQSSDIANATKAIFAADAGIEWQIYKLISDNGCKTCEESPYACPQPSFSNNVTLVVTCDSKTDPINNSIISTIKSKGSSGNSHRALEISLTSNL